MVVRGARAASQRQVKRGVGVVVKGGGAQVRVKVCKCVRVVGGGVRCAYGVGAARQAGSSVATNARTV